MRLLDGLRGIDFSGIGDDSSDDSDSPSSYIQNEIAVGNSSGAQDVVDYQNLIAASTPNAAQIFDAFTGSAPAKPVAGEIISSPSLWSEMFSAPGSVAQSLTSTIDSIINPPNYGADISDGTGIGTGYNPKTGSYGYTQADLQVMRPPNQKIIASTSSADSVSQLAINAVTGAAQSVSNVLESAFGFGTPQTYAAQTPAVTKQSAGVQAAPNLLSRFGIGPAPAPVTRAAAPSGGSNAAPKTNTNSNAPSSFSQDVKAFTDGAMQIVGSIFALKQQGQQRQAAGAANPASGARGVKGKPGASAAGGSSMNTYLLIGGGILAVGALVFLVSKD